MRKGHVIQRFRGFTCIVTPVKQKKSNFSRQTNIWYARYISVALAVRYIKHTIKQEGRTLELDAGTNNVEDCPTEEQT